MTRAIHTSDQFLSMVREQDDGCWKWVGSLKRGKSIYGAVTLDGKGMGAHRAAWILFRGPIPAGLTIDHLCENTRCVNPLHLEPVTLRENILRASKGTGANNARKTHCMRGHAFDEANTITQCGGKRACRTCVADAARRNRRKRSAVDALLAPADIELSADRYESVPAQPEPGDAA